MYRFSTSLSAAVVPVSIAAVIVAVSVVAVAVVAVSIVVPLLFENYVENILVYLKSPFGFRKSFSVPQIAFRISKFDLTFKT